MFTSIDQFRIFENNQSKFYIYIGHGTDEGVVEFWPGHEFWNFDANKTCPMGWDILNPLHKYSMGDDRFPMSWDIEKIRDRLADNFEYCEVITVDEIPKYCKGYEPPPKEINWVNIRACYPHIKEFTKMADKYWKMFVRDLESELIYARIHNLTIDSLCKQFYYSLQPYVEQGKISLFMYKDLCDIIDSQFEPEKGTLK